MNPIPVYRAIFLAYAAALAEDHKTYLMGAFEDMASTIEGLSKPALAASENAPLDVVVGLDAFRALAASLSEDVNFATVSTVVRTAADRVKQAYLLDIGLRTVAMVVRADLTSDPLTERDVEILVAKVREAASFDARNLPAGVQRRTGEAEPRAAVVSYATYKSLADAMPEGVDPNDVEAVVRTAADMVANPLCVASADLYTVAKDAYEKIVEVLGLAGDEPVTDEELLQAVSGSVATTENQAEILVAVREALGGKDLGLVDLAKETMRKYGEAAQNRDALRDHASEVERRNRDLSEGRDAVVARLDEIASAIGNVYGGDATDAPGMVRNVLRLLTESQASVAALDAQLAEKAVPSKTPAAESKNVPIDPAIGTGALILDAKPPEANEEEGSAAHEAPNPEVLEPPPFREETPEEMKARLGIVEPAQPKRVHICPNSPGKPDKPTPEQRVAVVARLANDEDKSEIAKAVGLANGRVVQGIAMGLGREIRQVREEIPEMRGELLDRILRELKAKEPAHA